MLMRISAMCSLTLSNIGNNAITQHTSALPFELGSGLGLGLSLSLGLL